MSPSLPFQVVSVFTDAQDNRMGRSRDELRTEGTGAERAPE
jgi:hypothetical protein